jgi:hypothetical protein
MALTVVVAPALRAQTAATADQAPPAGAVPAPDANGLLRFINRMPELISQTLPKLDPEGAYWFYARPRFGDPFKGDFFRLGLGGWLKVTDHLSLNAGTQTYIWRDANENDVVRSGLFSVNTGVKYVLPLSTPVDSVMSFGLNFASPVSRPPIDLVDGYRHTDPYFSYSRPLVPRIRLVAFSTLGADLLDRTPLPTNFGTNELHANSLFFSVGVSRPWKRFSASLALNGATTALLSKPGRQVVSLNPQVFIPLFPTRITFARITIALGGKALTGPDGRQFGASASLRWDFRSRPYGGPR